MLQSSELEYERRNMLCPCCSVPGGKQYYIKKLHINFEETVDMCPNAQCSFLQFPNNTTSNGCPVVTSDIITNSAARVDEFEQLLNSLFDATADSGVDTDLTDQSVSSWGSPRPEAAGPTSDCLSVTAGSEASSGSGSAGAWPRSAPCSVSAAAASVAAAPGPHSEPDRTAAGRRGRRRAAAVAPPAAGLVLKTFRDSACRPPPPPPPPPATERPASQRSSGKSRRRGGKGLYGEGSRKRPVPVWERVTAQLLDTANPFLDLMYGHDQAARRRIRAARAAARTAAAPSAGDRPDAPPAAGAAGSAHAAGPAGAARPAVPAAGPAEDAVRRPAELRPSRGPDPRQLAAQLSDVRNLLKSDQVYVRRRQVQRVRAWARKNVAAGTERR